MQKQLTFVIVAVVLMAAAVTVALYTANVANAQGNMTAGKLAKNMTGGAGANMTKNMTGAGKAMLASKLANRTK